MMVLVSYDVSTQTPAGKKRLRKIAEQCSDYGRRVQLSVFECEVDPSQWEVLKNCLFDLYDPKTDSLRFYFLGSKWKKRVEHYGAKKITPVDEVQVI